MNQSDKIFRTIAIPTIVLYGAAGIHGEHARNDIEQQVRAAQTQTYAITPTGEGQPLVHRFLEKDDPIMIAGKRYIAFPSCGSLASYRQTEGCYAKRAYAQQLLDLAATQQRAVQLEGRTASKPGFFGINAIEVNIVRTPYGTVEFNERK